MAIILANSGSIPVLTIGVTIFDFLSKILVSVVSSIVVIFFKGGKKTIKKYLVPFSILVILSFGICATSNHVQQNNTATISSVSSTSNTSTFSSNSFKTVSIINNEKTVTKGTTNRKNNSWVLR